MSLIADLKTKAKEIKKQLAAVYYVSKDSRVGFLPKAIIALTILYALSPIDLIPDFIPVFGYLDDIIIVPALITLVIRLIPLDVWEEAKDRALAEPIRLRKNWTFAIIFVLLWIVVLWWLGSIVYTIVK